MEEVVLINHTTSYSSQNAISVTYYIIPYIKRNEITMERMHNLDESSEPYFDQYKTILNVISGKNIVENLILYTEKISSI